MLANNNVIERESWRARLFREEDRASLLRLSAAHYGVKEPGQEGYFDWLYHGGPAGRPLVIVGEALESGEIIGFIWHVPIEAKVGSTDGVCQLGCNGLVHPDYRRQGIYVAFHDLVYEGLEESLFIYGFPKPVAVHPLKKVGVFQVSPIPLLVRPLNVAGLVQARFGSRPLSQIARLGWQVAGTTVWRPRRAKFDGWGLRVSAESNFDERFDAFWRRVKDKYDIMMKRDRRFLTWRFCHSAFRSYHILVAHAGEALAGYAVLRQADFEGVRTGLIMDFLVEPGERGAAAGLLLAEAAANWFEEAEVDLAGCLMLPHTEEYAILRQAGYIDCPERFAPQAFRLATTSLSPQVDNGVLAQPERWFVTMANHDAV